MKILVTGGAGFQGSHLSNYLVKEGHDVSVLNLPSEVADRNVSQMDERINVVFGSVTDADLVNEMVVGTDVVFHLAAKVNVDESLQDPAMYLEHNVMPGTLNVLEAVRTHGPRLIYASTCEVYGDGHDLADGQLLDETAELKPNSPYAASKAAADRLCHAYARSYDIDITIVRPFNIYGPRQKSGTFGALIPILVRKAMAGEVLTVFGDGEATRDYLYIDDLVKAYQIVLDHPELKGVTINFASGVNTSVKAIAEYIANKLNGTVENGPARPGEVMRFPSDITLANSLGFEPTVDIWEGIDKYIEWAKQQ
jgi:dTDP-glucose 4,6-dehydratase